MLRLTVKCVIMEKITRFGVSIKPDLLKKFDKIIRMKGYNNRSEALRDLIREKIIIEKNKNPNEKSIATLTILYDHHSGKLTNKLLELQHDNTNEILSTTHIHINHNTCLEVLVIKGISGKIIKLADCIKSLKGIKHGELVITKDSI